MYIARRYQYAPRNNITNSVPFTLSNAATTEDLSQKTQVRQTLAESLAYLGRVKRQKA